MKERTSRSGLAFEPDYARISKTELYTRQALEEYRPKPAYGLSCTSSDSCLTFVAMLDIISNMNQKSNNLGRFLQAVRDSKSLTLRAVEKATDISNAYLSQLESGKIKQPSPVILHKLSQLYEISYAEVLELAGYPIPDRSADAPSYAGLAARIGPVTEEEENALIEYLEFMRSRRKRGG